MGSFPIPAFLAETVVYPHFLFAFLHLSAHFIFDRMRASRNYRIFFRGICYASSKTVVVPQFSLKISTRPKTVLYRMKRKISVKIRGQVFIFKYYRTFFFIRIVPEGAIWSPSSRTIFFPDVRFSLNVQEQYALSFKTHYK